MAKNPGGRPTKLTPEIIEKARNYVDETMNVGVHVLLPTIEGLALELEISRETVYDWENVPEKTAKNKEIVELHQQFSDIVKQLRVAQGQKLIQNSLIGRYNPTIAKLILSGKHNYVEKTEVDQNVSGNVSFINDVPRPKNGEA